MAHIIYTSYNGKLDVDQRGKYTVSRTKTGIVVERISIYDDVQDTREYYRDGHYPALPENWTAIINEYGTTAADAWLHSLDTGDYTPSRVIKI